MIVDLGPAQLAEQARLAVGPRGAWLPDLAGCVAVAKSRTEVEELIAQTIVLHVESLPEHGEPVSEPSFCDGPRAPCR